MLCPNTKAVVVRCTPSPALVDWFAYLQDAWNAVGGMLTGRVHDPFLFGSLLYVISGWGAIRVDS